MDPGEYPTNVLSSNNFASIQYEYLEYQSPFSGTTRKQLQKLETAWRQEGLLVHCDAFKEGIWRFRSANNGTTDPQSQTSSVTKRSIIEVQGKGLVLKEKGIYEPASLGRSKHNSTSSFSTSSISSSPSSSLESTIRNAQSLNSRAVQGNSNQSAINEPPTPSPGVKSATGLPENWPVLKDIHECFVSAALGSIVYFLCHDHAFVPLNSRTLILRTSDIKSSEVSVDNSICGFDTVTLATLDISLTSLGTIVIKAQSDIAPGLQNLTSISNPSEGSTNIAPGAPLWLAPGGNAAKFYANRDDKNLPGSLLISHLQTNPTDLRLRCFNGVTIQSWQSKCLDWLSAKGLNTTILEDGGWIFVQVMNGNTPYLNSEYPGNPMLEDLTIVPWPSLLCFQTAGSGDHDVQSLPMNPLAFAEEWFVNRDDRAAVIAKRQKERHAAELKSKEQADMDARAAQAIIYSPAALRRGSNAGAMYPTPPDAIHHPIGATPSFDGTVSTPGQPNGLFVQDVEPTPHHTALVNTSIDADMWGSASKKDEANTSMNFNDTDNGNDNLFDDVGVDMFADITDADFSFFDEPDAVQLEQPPLALGDATAMTLETSDPMDLITMETADPAPAIIPATQVQDSGDEKTTDMVAQDVSLQKKDPAEADEIPKVLEKVDNKKAFRTPMISPPFDMESIFKRVARDPSLDSKPADRRRSSVFNKVDFETSILSVNEKYGTNGRFKFSDEIKVLPIAESPSLPKSQYLNQRRKHLDFDQESRSLIRLLRDDSQVVEVTTDEDHEMRYLIDSDLASQISEQDDTSHTTDDVSLMLKPGVKRKWTGDNDGEDMSSSFNALAVEYAQSAGTPLSITGSQIPLLEGDPADWSLTTYFTTPEPDVQSNVMSDLESIATAQILADQAVSNTLKLPGSATCFGSKANTPFYKISSTKELMHTLVKATKSCFKDITKCTMQAYLEIQGIPVLNQAHRLPPRPIPNPRSGHIQDPSRTNNPFLISPPQLEVRRADSKLSILPSAIHFWDNLGLGPSEGNKDVSAVCVYPNIDGVSGSAITFLDQMQNTYEASRLGSHERLESKDMIDSLLPYTVDMTQQGSRIHQLASLKETTARLSRVLSSLRVEDKNFVVYFIYPVDNAALLVHICSAFQHLFNLYRKSLSEKKATAANELVLQLVPLDFIASSISIVVPWPAEYSRLAMEVYDRCIDFKSYSSTPAILLEQPLPKNIDFKLTANPSASLLQENSCLHVAYAQSIDDRWITAAWTDNRGTKQMTASYCLGRKNEPISMPFSDVANEIWETTLDIISIKRIHWRIMITRVGVMDPSELEFWTGLAATESNAQINLTLLTVQTDPSLRLLPPSITLPPTSNPNQAISPVSTPQAPSIVSPDTASTPIRDANASAATPGETPAEPDSDARLIDYTDQTWGTVLAHRLNNSNSLLDLNPALISGYLIKRGGTNSDDPPIVMEVSIVHSEVVGNPRTFHEALLREVLGYYRGLGTLARVRGVVDPVKDIRPWHIAAAEKAVKALYMLM